MKSVPLQSYLELVRFSHTLFALPFALAAMLLAAEGFPHWTIFVKIVLAMVFCRNAAMAFNRFVDAEIDAQNPRTQRRHIPAGILSKTQVVLFFGVNAVAFIAVTWFINRLAFGLSVPTLFIVAFYSVTKRFTRWCHLFLGIAIGISPIGAWIAVTGAFAWPPVWLGLALTFWIAGFDIIYATQDHDFDRKNGLHSLVVQYGVHGSMRLSMGFHGAMLLFLLLFWRSSALGTTFAPFIAGVAGLLVYIHGFRNSDSLDALNRDFFLANVAISLMVLCGIAVTLFAV